MSFGANLQFLRKMHNAMTQEELAGNIGVSRQTISKWEMDGVFPEMEKAIALCKIFNCTLDELLREDMNQGDDAYSNIRREVIPKVRYYRYVVISYKPEEDAKQHVRNWAEDKNITHPVLIGWDFPCVSQEQVNVYHMHGYCAACLLPEEYEGRKDIVTQSEQSYVAITIKDLFSNPFVLIPNAYKRLSRYIEMNGLDNNHKKNVIECFEREYEVDGITYMDVYIAID